MNDFMEGVDYNDYCPECGELLHYVMTLPDGTKKMVAHETGSVSCKIMKESNIVGDEPSPDDDYCCTY